MDSSQHHVFRSPTFIFVLIMMGLGLVQVYSASFVYSTEVFNNGLFFFERHLVNVGVALVALILVSRIPLAFLEKWGWVLWILAAGMLLLCFIPGLGVRAGGATRWLRLPFSFRFEPSELAKVSFCFLAASLMIYRETNPGRFRKKGFLVVLAVLFVAPLLILLKQPDFGSFALILTVGGLLLFTSGLAWKWFLGFGVAAAFAFYTLIMQVPYRKARLISFLDPWSDPAQKGFQVIQSMLSFSSGEFFGVGLGQGQGKLFFLPEAHTDFTLAVYGEETGFIGFVLLMLMYGLLIHRGLRIARTSHSNYAKYLALALTATFTLNVFTNMGVALGMLPTKGLTLPFMSYGGSSLLMLGVLFGTLINLERQLPQTSEGRSLYRGRRVTATVARI